MIVNVQIQVRQQWSWRGLLFKARGGSRRGWMRIEAGEIILAKRDATIGWWWLHHTISSRRNGGKCVQDSATSTSLLGDGAVVRILSSPGK